MIDDADIVKALQPIAGQSLDRPHSGYSLRVISAVDGVVRVYLTRGPLNAHVRVNMPSSGLPMPWLFAESDDAEDWVGQLLVFLDEEVDTGGLGAGVVREDINGDSYVVVTGYGFKLTDKMRHQNLDKLFGPHGMSPATAHEV